MSSYESSISNLLSQLFLAEQVHNLHLSIINLLDMANEGEIDLILENPAKTNRQKKLYLEKVIAGLPSPELQNTINSLFSSEDFSFFDQKNLAPFLRQLQVKAEAVEVVKLTVALKFRTKDIQEMATTLSNQLGKQAVLELTFQSDLIGGAIIQYGNYISDYSIKSRIQQFREHWHKAIA